MSLSTVIMECMSKGIILERDAIAFLKTGEEIESIVQHFNLQPGAVITKQMVEEYFRKQQIPAATPQVIVHRPTTKVIAKDYAHKVDVEREYEIDERTKNVDTFVRYFNNRYERFKSFFTNRADVKNPVSLGRFTKSSNDQNVTVIGLVTSKSKTNSGSIILELEDPTGRVNVFIKDGKNIGENNVLEDEVIAVRGNFSRGYLFADAIIWPDIPFPQRIAKIQDPLNAVFISDLHYGSKKFLPKVEERFLTWLKSDDVDATRVKYLFIAGDLVDGIGIYASHKSDLEIVDVFQQYRRFEEFVEKIPDHIQVILCPGNHDAVRLPEPQPRINKTLLPNILKLNNVHSVCNPCYVNIHNLDAEGIRVLMYHGYSFTSLIDALPDLRKHGMTKPQYVMKDVLKRRHLAPLFGATLVSPEDNDHLIIDKVPDIFQTGDLHSHAVDNYKGVTLINSSTWQGQTAFMDRVGHIGNPGKVTVVDLQTRQVIVKDFYQGGN